VFSLDPTLSRRTGATAVLSMPWEPLKPGPVGSRIAVLDYTPDGTRIPGVDLDHPYLLATDGLDPDESDPQFHQQMVYAVIASLLETLDNARGRRLVWRNVWRTSADGPGVRPMSVFPHRARAANAFYSPGEGLSFGSFVATEDPGMLFPGQWVHGCLSHDIVNHEAGHAFLHELRPLSLTPTGPDALAFHEGFADILAILQHFTLPGLLEAQIAQGGAPLWEPGPFIDLAVEFGHGSGKGRAVRTALTDPAPGTARSTPTEPHERGAVLVAALFEAFFAAYSQRIQPVLRVAGLKGAAQARSLPTELVTLLCGEARIAAQMVLAMAVRAIDYLPAIDISFAAFLDAMIAADNDLFPEDRNGFRRSLVEACRRRGIYPSALPGSLDRVVPDLDRWEPLPTKQALVMATRDLAGASRLPAPAMRGAGRLDRDWTTALLSWGRRNARLLGLDAATLAVDGGNASLRVNQDGFPTAVVSARFVQRAEPGTIGLPKRLHGVPLIGGTTIIAEGSGRIRHAVHSPVPGVGAAGEALLGRLVAEAQPLALDALDCLRVEPPANATTSSAAGLAPVPRPRRRAAARPAADVGTGATEAT
jgi:hypothetical protein